MPQVQTPQICEIVVSIRNYMIMHPRCAFGTLAYRNTAIPPNLLL